MREDEIAIKVDGVYKDFNLPHLRKNSLKSLFTGMFDSSAKHKGTETQHALKDISFEIKKGEFFGIVGRNGSGKSTLLKILAGIYQPTKGNISAAGRLVPFIELGVGFNPELTGRENVYLNGSLLGFSKKEIDDMYEEIVEFAEIKRFMDQKLKNYSSGMQVRLAFSMAIRADADILLVDEVLAVGDADFQRKCFAYFKELKKNQKTVVFVTHDMNSVREYCDRAMLIDDSEVRYVGSSNDVAKKYSLLFMGENLKHSDSNKIENRWGNNKLEIDRVITKKTGEYLRIAVESHANQDIDRVIYGIHIVAQDGSEVTAMNNRMIQAPDIEMIKKGKKVTLTWEILNIFNDGEYSVTVTLIDDLSDTLDWYVDASKFSIRREARSTTSVLPPLRVSNKIE